MIYGYGVTIDITIGYRMDLTVALRTFVRTIDRGSMTAAARDLGISQPAVSKILKNLEQHVGSRLIERTSRAMRPTPAGLVLYDASATAMSTIDGAIETIRSDTGIVRGSLRLHGPVCVGERHLHRIVGAFQDRHPHVTVDLILENRVIDLIHENIDVAVRMGRPEDQSLIIRKIGDVRRILVASKSYLAKHGAISRLEDLEPHPLLVTDSVLSRQGLLKLVRGDAPCEVAARPTLTTNNVQVLLGALMAGRGIAAAQVLLVSDAMARGELVRVLPEYDVIPRELYIAYPSAKFVRPAVRAFIDHVVPALRSVEGID